MVMIGQWIIMIWMICGTILPKTCCNFHLYRYISAITSSIHIEACRPWADWRNDSGAHHLTNTLLPNDSNSFIAYLWRCPWLYNAEPEYWSRNEIMLELNAPASAACLSDKYYRSSVTMTRWVYRNTLQARTQDFAQEGTPALERAPQVTRGSLRQSGAPGDQGLGNRRPSDYRRGPLGHQRPVG